MARIFHGTAPLRVSPTVTSLGRLTSLMVITAWLPTLVPDSDEVYKRVISAIDMLIEIQRDKPVAHDSARGFGRVGEHFRELGALPRGELIQNRGSNFRREFRKNVGGLVVYTFGYSLLLQPARFAGYLAGLIKPRTKKA